MSRRNSCCCEERPMGGFLGGAFSSNILNLIIFVLIVLQFGKRDGILGGEHEEECGREREGEIDNSILFIIALFFLFVCSCGAGGGCGMGGY
jgi:hypothetical protein